jgi:thiamine biosynthesis lipoprotein
MRCTATGTVVLKTINRGRALGAAAWLVWSVSVLASAPRLYEAAEPHMGALIRIKLYAEGPQQSSAAFRAAFDRVAELDEALSDYKPASELNRICRSAVGKPVKVSQDLFRVLAASLKLSEDSAGAFDVTLGPVIRLWRQARTDHRLPRPEALREAAGRCGYSKLHLDAAAGTVLLDQPGMQLDLGAIAKGYAADAALLVLAQSGIRSALVAASGDLAIGEPPPGQHGWKIGVSRGGSDGALESILVLHNAAVSTSGDAEQHLEIDGKRYSHIVDPATNMGLTIPITVTIVARRGMDADSLATAVSVLGADRGMAVIQKHPDAAALIVTGEGAAMRVVESPGWDLLSHQDPLP